MATHLRQSESAQFWRLPEGQFDLAAHTGTDPLFVDYLSQDPIPTNRGSVTGRAVLERRVVHLPDCLTDSEYVNRGHQAIGKYRTMLGVPLLRDGVPLGVIALLRNAVKPFTQKQIELVATFADQAVIAIENTRLFEEVQARTRDLTEALEQQTATADVLKVISRSALDVQKVLDALVESAARLCNAYDAVIFQVFGDGLRIVAHHGQIPLAGSVGQITYPHMRGRIPGRAVLDQRAIQVADMLTEAMNTPRAGRLHFKSVLAPRSPCLWSTQARQLG